VLLQGGGGLEDVTAGEPDYYREFAAFKNHSCPGLFAGALRE